MGILRGGHINGQGSNDTKQESLSNNLSGCCAPTDRAGTLAGRGVWVSPNCAMRCCKADTKHAAVHAQAELGSVSHRELTNRLRHELL